METTEIRKRKDKQEDRKVEPVLAEVKEELGFVPDLMRVFADAPVVLEAYWRLLGCFDKSSLSPLERHVVLLTVSHENDSLYCVEMVLSLARKKGNLPDDVLEAAARGQELRDKRLKALVDFTRSTMRKKGKISSEELAEFQSAGYTPAHAMEVILGVAQKTLANYIGNLTEKLLDPHLSSRLKK